MVEKRHLLQHIDTFGRKETLFEKHRHLCRHRDNFWWERDTCLGVQTRLEEQSHMCRHRDTFWRERVTCVNVQTHLVERKETPVLDIEALLKEKRHFSRRGDTLGGKDTPVSA